MSIIPSRNCLTCPCTQEQNGVIERKHQHLVQVPRLIKNCANIPIKFCGHFILCVTYIINWTLSRMFRNKSLYELLYNWVLDYSQFKIFGCAACALQHKQGNKFSSKVIVGIFMGIPKTQRGLSFINLLVSILSLVDKMSTRIFFYFLVLKMMIWYFGCLIKVKISLMPTNGWIRRGLIENLGPLTCSRI